ncbi:MAG: Fic family protein [Desulfitobacterium sp.]|nr:Fic family protein [Desulfitobacterium sp.]
MEKKIHDLHFVARYKLEEIATKELIKKQLLEEMLLEESYFSSFIEGAFTTKKRAREVVKTNKASDTSEQMVLNNFNAMNFILDNLDKEINEDLFIQIHRILTRDILKKEDISDGYRNDKVYVADPNLTAPVFIPPNHELISSMMNDLFNFINDASPEKFIQPLIKAFIIHFYIGYVHPFFDGNGRVARAISYMYLLKQGYEFFKFFSISSIINKDRKRYYQSFIDAENKDLDITYFICTQLDITLESVKAVIDKLYKELKDLHLRETLAIDGVLLSPRQEKCITFLEKKESNIVTIKDYEKKFKVSYETARRDLLELSELGFFTKHSKGKKFVFLYQGLGGYLAQKK